MELWELSDGMLRFLCLAASLLNPVPPPVIAVDEPESGLHPKLLPVVADMIKTASERKQVLITTHSPDLLNRFEIDDLAVITRGEEFNSKWHRPSDRKSLVEMLKDVTGETVGDLHRSGELEAIG
jgi:predicted ATPase